MFSKLGKVTVSLVVAAFGLVSLIGDANAANLNTHALAFRTYSPSQSDYIIHAPEGIYSAIHQSVEVIGPVLRGSTDSSSQGFYIDGTNTAGATTSFVLYAYDWQGNLQSSVSFSATAPEYDSAYYDSYQTLSSIDNYSYVSLYAVLPAYVRGTFRGITAMQ